MLKLKILLVVVLIGYSTAANIFDELDIGECPDFDSIDNLDIKKLTGIWYIFAVNEDLYNPSMSCDKLNAIDNGNGSFSLDISAIKIDGSEFKDTITFETDSEHEGELLTHATVEDETLLGPQKRDITVPSAVIYTDYDNIAVFYSCYETKSFLWTKNHVKFHIVTRKRDFDSLKVFGEAAAALKELDFDLDDIRFIYNGPNCKN